jgi:hypothetical protein
LDDVLYFIREGHMQQPSPSRWLAVALVQPGGPICGAALGDPPGTVRARYITLQRLYLAPLPSKLAADFRKAFRCEVIPTTEMTTRAWLYEIEELAE